jgi:hypothetical protein
MSRRPARFTEADIRRAMKVMREFGSKVFLLILPDGSLKIGFDETGNSQMAGLQNRVKVVV